MTPEQRALLEDKARLWREQSSEGNMELRDYHRRCADAMEAALAASLQAPSNDKSGGE